MTGNTQDILINAKTKVDNKEFKKLEKQLEKINKFEKFKRMSAEVSAFNKEASRLETFLTKGQKAAIGFNGAALSGLFFGMQLQKTFGGALKSIFEGYKKIMPEASEFNKQTTRLSANWEFFKFQLADALSKSPLFQSFIQFLINMLKALQGISPEVKAIFGYVLAIGAVIGAWMFTINTVKLGVAGVIDGMQLLDATTGKFSWGQIAKYGFLTLAAAAIVAAWQGMELLHKHSKTAAEKWEGLKEAGRDLIDSIFEPMGIEIENIQEVLIIFGAIAQNVIGAVIAFFGALVATLRIVFNSIQIVVESLYRLATAWQAIKKGDFMGAIDEIAKLKKSAKRDLADIQNAFMQTGQISQKVMDNWITGDDVAESILNARAEIDRGRQISEAGGTNGGATNVNQVYIEGALQSVAPETKETADKFISAITGDVLGVTGR